DIISKDQALTANLLRLVNSAFYGFPSRIDTISRAVTIIGTRQLSTLALGLSVISRFRNIPPEVMDMESFWKHSIACAIGARTLAGLARLQGSESFFVCGLLHDLGKLIMLDRHPSTYQKVLSWARHHQVRLARAEKQFFCHDHTYFGGYILKTWKLPLKIEQAVRYHDNPSRARFQTEAALVNMANILATGCLLGNAGEIIIPAPDAEIWQRCGLDSSALYECSRLMSAQVDNIYNLIFSHV
ncbi:MAG: HDOD domain-containing protein, partial [Desulfonatronovibrionaceae bacterium]